MSIADELVNYNTFLTNAYTKCQEKGATIPESKNLQNLESTIESITGGGGSGTAAGREVNVEAVADINADSLFVGTKGANFKEAVTSSSIGTTFIALSQDGRVGIHAQTLNATTTTFKIWFLNDDGVYEVKDFPISLTYTYSTMTSTSTKINHDGTLATIGHNYPSDGDQGLFIIVNIDPDEKTATFDEIKDFYSTNIPTTTEETSTTRVVTTYGDTVQRGYMGYDYRLAGNQISFMNIIPYTKETTTLETGAVTTSSGTTYVEASYKITGSSVTRVSEKIISAVDFDSRKYGDDTVHWIDSSHYLVFPRSNNTNMTNGTNSSHCYVYKYKKSSGGDSLVTTYDLYGNWPTSTSTSYTTYKYARFSPSGEYVIVSALGTSSKSTDKYQKVFRLNDATGTATKTLEFSSAAKSSGSVADDGITTQVGGYIYRNTETLVSSGAEAPINRVFNPKRWVSSTKVLHLASPDEDVEYYISPTTTTKVASGQVYGICNRSMVAGERGTAQLLVELDTSSLALQDKVVTPTTADQVIVPDAGFNGLNSVTVSAVALQDKSVTPTATEQTITPDAGYTGLSQVTIAGDDDLKAGNIKEGVNIFGITGTLTSSSEGDEESPYTLVEYIEDSGTQYINTGVLNSSSIVVVTEKAMDGSINKLSGVDYVSGSTRYRYKWGTNGNGNLYYGYGASNYEASVKPTIDKWYRYTLGNGNQKIEDVASGSVLKSSTATMSSYSSSYNILLFQYSDSGTGTNGYASGKSRIRSSKIYNNGVLIRDFVPSIRKSDGVAGMLDKVTEVFYPNAGTGTFTTGPVVEEDTGETYDQLVNYTMLYDSGDECTSVTGGWNGTSYYTNAKVTENDTYIQIHSYRATAYTTSKVDMTGYNKMLLVTSTRGRNSTTYNSQQIRAADSISVKTGYMNSTTTTIMATNVNTTAEAEYNFLVDIPTDCQTSKHIGVVSDDDACNGFINMYNFAILKADDWATLAEKAGITASSIDDILTNSETLLSNEGAVEFMIKQCTGDFMASAVANETFLTALASSSHKDTIQANEHWNKFLSMVE